MNLNKKDGGMIENWTFNILSVPVEMLKEKRPDVKVDKAMILSGNVAEDPTGRFQIGWHMRSSLVMDYDEVNGIVETDNTIYHVKGEMLKNADMGDLILKVFY